MSRARAALDGVKASRAKRVELYRAAAKLIEDELQPYCCFALGHVGLTCGTFAKWFRDDAIAFGKTNRSGMVLYEAWMNNARLPLEFGDVVRDCRVLALCFMAAMVEAGDA